MSNPPSTPTLLLRGTLYTIPFNSTTCLLGQRASSESAALCLCTAVPLVLSEWHVGGARLSLAASILPSSSSPDSPCILPHPTVHFQLWMLHHSGHPPTPTVWIETQQQRYPKPVPFQFRSPPPRLAIQVVLTKERLTKDQPGTRQVVGRRRDVWDPHSDLNHNSSLQMPAEVGSSYTCHSTSQSLSQSLRPQRKAMALSPSPNHPVIKADRRVAAETEGNDKG